MGTPAVPGSGEGCMCEAPLLVAAWEGKTSGVFVWEEFGWRKDSTRAVKMWVQKQKKWGKVGTTAGHLLMAGV